ncbi:MAG TPA: hypothetical protein VMP01_20605 [Pirellulaceae bacterium]|nr:hypothetical protein [Pirellulaceae bacterium]
MKRRGASLLETMVAIGLSGIVATIVTTLLAAMWRAEQRLRADLNERWSLSRLELALRQDVHEATDGNVSEDQLLTLNLGEQDVIVYSVDRHRIVRTRLFGELTGHRESFTLASDSGIQWSIENRLVRMTIEAARDAASTRGTAHFAIVEAALGSRKLLADRREGSP